MSRVARRHGKLLSYPTPSWFSKSLFQEPAIFTNLLTAAQGISNVDLHLRTDGPNLDRCGYVHLRAFFSEDRDAALTTLTFFEAASPAFFGHGRHLTATGRRGPMAVHSARTRI